MVEVLIRLLTRPYYSPFTAPHRCYLPLFIANLEASLVIIDCPQIILAFNSPQNIDAFVVSFTEAIKLSEANFPFIPPGLPLGCLGGPLSFGPFVRN